MSYFYIFSEIIYFIAELEINHQKSKDRLGFDCMDYNYYFPVKYS